jgi:hypothetical protein
MKACVLTLALAIYLPVLGLAQDDTRPCWDCTLSLSDTADFSAEPIRIGHWDPSVNPQKNLYLGIVYSPTATFEGLTGIEFSIQGLPETFLPPTITIRDGGMSFGESIEAPDDPTLPEAAVGWNVVWSECQPGNRTLIEISLISFEPIPDDTVIRVMPKFPPTVQLHAAFAVHDVQLPPFHEGAGIG